MSYTTSLRSNLAIHMQRCQLSTSKRIEIYDRLQDCINHKKDDEIGCYFRAVGEVVSNCHVELQDVRSGCKHEVIEI